MGSFQLLWAGECQGAAFSHCFLLGRIGKISHCTLHIGTEKKKRHPHCQGTVPERLSQLPANNGSLHCWGGYCHSRHLTRISSKSLHSKSRYYHHHLSFPGEETEAHRDSKNMQIAPAHQSTAEQGSNPAVWLPGLHTCPLGIAASPSGPQLWCTMLVGYFNKLEKHTICK